MKRLLALAFLPFACPLPAAFADAESAPIFPPAPVVESFDSLPPVITNAWKPSAVEWTSSVVVAGAPVAWTAFNVRRDAVAGSAPPAIGLQSPGKDAKGFLASGPIATSCQRISFSYMNRSKGTNEFEVFVNGVSVGTARTTSTNDAWTFEADTVDSAANPACPLPFEGPVSVLVSNTITGANLAIDDVTLTPWTLFVTIQGDHDIYAGSGEFGRPDADFVARPHFPEGFVPPEGSTLSNAWTVSSGFAGDILTSDTSVIALVSPVADLSSTLTLIPGESDIGSTVTLAHTATLSVPGQPDFSHTAAFTVRIAAADNPRYVDFEDGSFAYPPSPPETILVAGYPWSVQNARTSVSNEPWIGSRSLRLFHESASKPAFFASEFSYTEGIGTVSFRYANYSAKNSSLALVVQAASENSEPDSDDPGADPEGWFDLPDATLVVTNHPDINDCEFRVDAQLDAPHRIRILTTSGVTPGADARANIDNLHIRPYGSNAPVLVFRGPRAIPALADWNASFVYIHPEPGYTWSWTLEGDLPGLAVETNAANHSLDFSLHSLPADTSVRTLTVAVYANGVKDQQLSIPLAVVAYPTFDLEPVATAFTNIVDVWVRNVQLHGEGTNYSVAWSVAPPFAEGSTNSVHNKSRYRVIDISQSNETTHVLTAVLREKSTGLETANTVEIVVKPDPSLNPDPPPATQPSFISIVPSTADSTLVLAWTNLDPAILVTTSTLTNWPDTGILTNSPATLPLANSPAFFRLQVPPPP